VTCFCACESEPEPNNTARKNMANPALLRN
jgi:hypothetical protein